MSGGEAIVDAFFMVVNRSSYQERCVATHPTPRDVLRGGGADGGDGVGGVERVGVRF